MNLESSELGKVSGYRKTYSPELLFTISREIKRKELGISGLPLFHGVDIWTSFEVSWLDMKGKPHVRIAVFEIDALSEFLIESKSLKLYLNSFNGTCFDNDIKVAKLIQRDLSKAVNGKVNVTFYKLENYSIKMDNQFNVISLDKLDVSIIDYNVNPNFLKVNSSIKVHEKLSSDLLKSNCPVTLQPDWGSILIEYLGNKIDHEGLLKYLISFRENNEFHEQCIERIYSDIMKYCKPQKLCVYARYTRRGGLDINPIRTNTKFANSLKYLRLSRQ